MKETLKLELQAYLGDVMQQIENSYDWFEKRKLERKKQAFEVLLEVPTIYLTPEKIIDYVIKNPPYNVRENTK